MAKKIKNALSFNQITKVLQEEAVNLSNLVLSDRQVNDLELILNGAFNPVNKFMVRKDYNSVLKDMRLSDGSLWPIPITLDISKGELEIYNLTPNSKIALRDKEGFLIAIMTIEDIWEIDKKNEALSIYNTTIKNILALIIYIAI